MPSTIRWTGNALAVAQVNTYTFTGTWLSTEHVTATINGKAIVTLTGSATIATIISTVAAALNASKIAEFKEITYTANPTTLVATGDTAGYPFTLTLSTDSASGLINGGASSAGTATVACTGPSFVDNIQNYSTGALPVTGDTLNIDNSSVPLLYNLSALSGVTLANLNISLSFTNSGTIGLPKTNPGGYNEYRPDFFQISATACSIGTGNGNGSGRIKLDFGSNATNCQVLASGSSSETPLESVLLKGTSASNVFTFKGTSTTAALAPFLGDVSNCLNLQCDSATVRCGAGVTFASSCAVQNYNGNLTINSAIGASGVLTNSGGTTTIRGSGAIPTLTITGGVVDEQGTGTITQLNVGPGLFGCANDSRARTITSTTFFPGGVIFDPTNSIVYTNNPGYNSAVKRVSASAT